MHLRNVVASLALGALTVCLAPTTSRAAGDAATRLNIFVSANNVAGRQPMLIVTNPSAQAATVSIIDDGADGDTDDSVTNIVLQQGQSRIVRISQGTVNDDYAGKADGDYFRIIADHPVNVMQATTSNWQHDWAPTEGAGGLGTSFFLYGPPTSGADSDVNVFAYHDGTEVAIWDITATPTTTGTTTVNIPGRTLVARINLNEGEDIIYRKNGLGLDIIDAGHTYWVEATQAVTVQYGHLGQVAGGNQARDGDGFIPSANGSSAGSLFYFTIPHNPGTQSEKELRIVCFDNSTVTLYGATPSGTGWTAISSSAVASGGHLDFVGANNTAFRTNDLYKLVVSPAYNRCTAYEANWMETGSFGTSDDASTVSSSNGYSMGNLFVAYIGPPGQQANVANPAGEATNIWAASGGYGSHLYINAADDNTGVTITDVDTNGGVVNFSFSLQRDKYFDFVIDTAMYNAMKTSGRRPYVRVTSNKPISVTSGNFNDNWLLFATGARPMAAKTTATLATTDATCGETVTLQARCDNVNGSTLASSTMTISAPSGASLGSPTLPNGVSVTSSSGARLVLSAGTLDSNGGFAADVPVTITCNNGCFSAQSVALQVECAGTIGGEVLADNATQSLLVTPSSALVDRLLIVDHPGYDGTGTYSAVSFDGLNLTSDVTLTLYRATDSGDPAAFTQIAQWTGNTAAAKTFSFNDAYALHYEAARFYKVVASASTCTTPFGPVTARTSSGSSGGNTSGLESNGRLAGLLARRALANVSRPNWIPTDMRMANSSKAQSAMFADQAAAAMLPAMGPLDSFPVNVTPPDLVGVTNAASAFAADYLTSDGKRVGSVLIVQTVGEYYEHNKALCDRANGSEISRLEVLAEPNGGVLRMALQNQLEQTGDYAVEFKVIEDQGRYQVVSQWHASTMPALSSTARVYNIQAWSAMPGIEISFADQMLQAMGLEFAANPVLPPRIFAKGATLGGDIELHVTHVTESTGPLALRALRKVGERIVTEELPLDDTGVVRLRATPFDEVTFELLQGASKVDQLWLSDGVWTWVDDTMADGHTAITAKDFTTCAEQTSSALQTIAADSTDFMFARNDVRFAGCASITADVDRSVGLARHFGGAAKDIDLAGFAAMSMTLQSSAPTQVCHETSTVPMCIMLPAYKTATRVQIPLAAFTELGSETCAAADLRNVRALTVTTFEPGAQTIAVRDVHYRRVVDDSAPDGDVVSPSCETPSSSGGCSTGGGRAQVSTIGWMLLAAVSLVRRGRRR